MALDWTHQHCVLPDCEGDTDCPNFPSLGDRIEQARGAFGEYAEADGNSLLDFVSDVLCLAVKELSAKKVRHLLKKAEYDSGLPLGAPLTVRP